MQIKVFAFLLEICNTLERMIGKLAKDHRDATDSWVTMRNHFLWLPPLVLLTLRKETRMNLTKRRKFWRRNCAHYSLLVIDTWYYLVVYSGKWGADTRPGTYHYNLGQYKFVKCHKAINKIRNTETHIGKFIHHPWKMRGLWNKACWKGMVERQLKVRVE